MPGVPPDSADDCAQVDLQHILSPQGRPQTGDLRDTGEVGAAGQERSVDGADGRADDHARPVPFFHQCVQHPHLEGSEIAAPAQHECRQRARGVGRQRRTCSTVDHGAFGAG